jgi:RAB6A-GEF complex partner protein 2
MSSSVSRSAAVPIHHPHARKSSIPDGQVLTGQLGCFAPPLTPVASTYSLTLDPIVESTASSAVPHPPNLDTPNMSTVFPASNLAMEDSSSRLVREREQPRVGHGSPPNSVHSLKPRMASADMTATPDELILYSYAQLSGAVYISPLADLPWSHEQASNLQALRQNLLTSKAIGGGNLDIASRNPSTLASHTNPTHTRRFSHGRSSSVSGSLLSALSASPASTFPTVSQQSTKVTRHSRTPSILASIFQHGANSVSHISGLGLATNLDDNETDTPLPTFEVQPSILAVDLNLGPGESRSCE